MIQRHPSVFLLSARWWKPTHSLLHRRTEFVIDGFTRSAVTFAAIAFQLAQDDHVLVAHHMHAVGPLVVAARRSLPTLVVAREPEPTILSALLKWPRVTPGQWLKTYAAFYESLTPYRDSYVIATFEQVTSDLGEVICRVNDRFGTRFREFEHSAVNVQAVFDLIEERAEGPPWQPLVGKFVSGLVSASEYRAATEVFRTIEARAQRGIPELRVQRPSPVREAAKAHVRDGYRSPDLAELRTRAEQAYRAFVGSPRSARSPVASTDVPGRQV